MGRGGMRVLIVCFVFNLDTQESWWLTCIRYDWVLLCGQNFILFFVPDCFVVVGYEMVSALLIGRSGCCPSVLLKLLCPTNALAVCSDMIKLNFPSYDDTPIYCNSSTLCMYSCSFINSLCSNKSTFFELVSPLLIIFNVLHSGILQRPVKEHYLASSVFVRSLENYLNRMCLDRGT